MLKSRAAVAGSQARTLGGLLTGDVTGAKAQQVEEAMPSRRVLIVDDQSDVRRVLRAGLETLGRDIKITDVPSGEEAILVVTRQPVDLLIADIRLPGISGLELKDKARKRSPNMHLILITGMTDDDMRQKLAEAGADAYFFKPIEMPGFLDMVQQLLGTREPPPTLKIRLEQAAEVPPQPVATGELGQFLHKRLADLRHEADAVCVALLDEQGRLIAQVGQFAGEHAAGELIPSLASICRASANVASLLGTGIPQDFISFLGPTSIYFLTHVGYSVGLLLVTPSATWDPERLWKLQRMMRKAVLDLRHARPDWAAPPPAEAIANDTLANPVNPGPEIETPLDLEAIFHQDQPGRLKAEDLNAFWESALDSPTSKTTGADGISYEQARQMGLAPKDD
jgi:CheY-like chemotaxis protein